MAFREQHQSRINVRDQPRASEDPFTQLRLAEPAAEIDAAYQRMLRNFAEMMRTRAGAEIALSLRARCRWDAGKATEWEVDAVHRLMMPSAAWRDVHAVQAATCRQQP